MSGYHLEGPFTVRSLLYAQGRKVLGEEIPKRLPERIVVVDDKDVEHGVSQLGDVGRF